MSTIRGQRGCPDRPGPPAPPQPTSAAPMPMEMPCRSLAHEWSVTVPRRHLRGEFVAVGLFSRATYSITIKVSDSDHHFAQGATPVRLSTLSPANHFSFKA